MPRPTITLDDVRTLARAISGNIDNNTFSTLAIEAEDIDLAQFLGEPFYKEFIDVFGAASPSPTPDQQKLFDGGTYDPGDGNEIRFRGIKQLLCYWTYTRLVPRAEQNLTRFGMKVKNTEQSASVVQGLIDQERNDANGVAQTIKRELRRFLDKEQATYPLWNKKNTTDLEGAAFFRSGPRVIMP